MSHAAFIYFFFLIVQQRNLICMYCNYPLIGKLPDANVTPISTLIKPGALERSTTPNPYATIITRRQCVHNMRSSRLKLVRLDKKVGLK